MIERIFLTGQIFALSNILSPAECQAHIVRAQLAGFDTQTYGTRTTADARRRAVLEDPAATAVLWERVAPWLPPLEGLYDPAFVPDPVVPVALTAYRPARLNPRLRYYRYEPGECFPRHFDIAYEESPEVRSFLTLIVYLNESCRGGETSFGDVAVNPRAGMALLFPHEICHEGAEITEGLKCVLRSDVMYQIDRSGLNG